MQKTLQLHLKLDGEVLGRLNEELETVNHLGWSGLKSPKK